MKNKTLMEHFETVEDPRLDRQRKHNLIDILVIAVCGVLSGFDTWVEIADYGRAKKQWFKTFLKLPFGIPSHDTFGRIFSLLKPESFQQAFLDWLNSLRIEGTKIINIDGKVLRGALKKAGDSKSALILVNAWAHETGVCLGQQRAKKGEKGAMESIVDHLFVESCIVTIDAGGATPRISQKIINAQGDYMIALKDNQPILFEYAQNSLKKRPRAVHRTEQKSHGRREKREYVQFNILDNIDFEDSIAHPTREIKKLFHDWPHAKSFVRVKTTRKVNKKTSEETRYYISSLENNLEEAVRAIRSHWGIENSLHYVLDVTFREDHSRMRLKYAAENMAYLRRMVLNMLKTNGEEKISIKRKRNKCNWSNQYLEETLFAQIQN